MRSQTAYPINQNRSAREKDGRTVLLIMLTIPQSARIRQWRGVDKAVIRFALLRAFENGPSIGNSGAAEFLSGHVLGEYSIDIDGVKLFPASVTLNLSLEKYEQLRRSRGLNGEDPFPKFTKLESGDE